MKSCQYKSSDELPLILNVQEVSNFLGLGLSQVYELVKRIDFPAFKVGSRTIKKGKKPTYRICPALRISSLGVAKSSFITITQD